MYNWWMWRLGFLMMLLCLWMMLKSSWLLYSCYLLLMKRMRLKLEMCDLTCRVVEGDVVAELDVVVDHVGGEGVV